MPTAIWVMTFRAKIHEGFFASKQSIRSGDGFRPSGE